jgi:hypothetical protein
MNDTRAHIDNLDQADEDILTYTVSDDALEAAAGIQGNPKPSTQLNFGLFCF